MKLLNARKAKRKTRNRAARKPDRARLKTGVMRLGAVVARMTAGVALAGLCVWGATEGYGEAARRGYLNIEKAIITGARTLTTQDVMELAGEPLGKNIMEFDLAAAGRALEAHPLIRNVTVKREFPSAVRLEINERFPVAAVDAGEAWLVDEDGVMLRPAEPGELDRLPLLTGAFDGNGAPEPGRRVKARAVRDAVYAVKRLDGYRLFGRHSVQSVDVSKPDRLAVRFSGAAPVLITPRGEWTDEAARLRTVDYILRGQEETVEYIDVSFENKVVVRSSNVETGGKG